MHLFNLMHIFDLDCLLILCSNLMSVFLLYCYHVVLLLLALWLRGKFWHRVRNDRYPWLNREYGRWWTTVAVADSTDPGYFLFFSLLSVSLILFYRLLRFPVISDSWLIAHPEASHACRLSYFSNMSAYLFPGTLHIGWDPLEHQHFL